MRRTLLLLILLLSTGSLAQNEGSVKVTIQSDPPGAKVIFFNEELGRTGTPFHFPRGKLSSRGTSVDFEVRKENYESHHVAIPLGEFSQSDLVYPDDPIQLTPLNFLVPILERPLPYVFGLVASLGVLGIVLRLRHQKSQAEKREQDLRILKEKTEDHDLLMSVFGNYRLLEPLGEGGLAKVFRGVPNDTLDHSKSVAVKLLHEELCDQQDHRERFIREGQVSKDLVHSNIVRLFELNQENDRVFLVLELLKGKTLRERFENGPVDVEEARSILDGIFAGLEYAHKKGIVHRDLTPGNIMLCDDGGIKLMDFGLARRRQVDKTVTVTGVIQGTPGYMAPEQLQEKVDVRSDQYSIGIVIYEMLSGARPFADKDIMQLLLATVTNTIPPLQEVEPSVPRPISDFVARLLEKKPDDRYTSMTEARDAFYEAWKAAEAKDSEPS